MGFAQLWNSEGKLLAQRDCLSKEAFQASKDTLWVVSEDTTCVYTETSDFCHPYKFFNALKKETIVNLFLDIYDPTDAKGILPTWIGRAEDVDSFISQLEHWDGEFLVLGEQSEWLGTSEY